MYSCVFLTGIAIMVEVGGALMQRARSQELLENHTGSGVIIKALHQVGETRGQNLKIVVIAINIVTDTGIR